MTQMATREYDLLVFDWDGTLMDSVGRITTCAQMSLVKLGFPEPEPSAVHAQIGKSLTLFMEGLVEGPPATIQSLCDAYRDIWLSDQLPAVKPFSGVIEMLEDLQSRGQSMAVATGKSRRGLDRDLEASGFKDFFIETRCADESGSKPDPAMLRWLISKCNLDPKRVLMIGDTAHDLEMAERAGIPSVGVLCGCDSAKTLLKFHPLALLKQTAHLQSWLGN